MALKPIHRFLQLHRCNESICWPLPSDGFADLFFRVNADAHYAANSTRKELHNQVDNVLAQ
ncbi:MAG: hypothetical protein DLM52_03305 [Chthoniobacterales bacterium]|nr:MAG: hypothetical protein DLM52_03305 [Chthoniobacterales bacterium]